MGDVEYARRRLNIEKLTDLKVLKERALWLLEQCRMLSKGSGGPDNYEVQWWDIRTQTWAEDGDGVGTKDHCIGYMNGLNRHVGPLQVVRARRLHSAPRRVVGVTSFYEPS